MFPRIVFFFFFLVISISFGLENDGAGGLPSETECRPYIEKALQREAGALETHAESSQEIKDDVGEPNPAESIETEATEIPEAPPNSTESPKEEEDGGSEETNAGSQEAASVEMKDAPDGEDSAGASVEVTSEASDTSVEGGVVSEEVEIEASVEVTSTEEDRVKRQVENESEETKEAESVEAVDVAASTANESGKESIEDAASAESNEEVENVTETKVEESKEDQTTTQDETSQEKEGTGERSEEESKEEESASNKTEEEVTVAPPDTASEESTETTNEQAVEEIARTDPPTSAESNENATEIEAPAETHESTEQSHSEESKEETSEEKVIEESPEEELTMGVEIPKNLRPRDHMAQILRFESGTDETENLLSKTIDSTLKELKKLYEAAIKPLEILYKYRDLSNRHFGDPEIFSKPLILFMGPWSGGKSTIINYLLENEYKKTALRTGAEPSPAYFNIVMWGEKEEVLDGTQLAADWTFSGLQKFGQGLLDRLRGLKLNHPLLQKVNIVEIPGILEIRKQVERLFPFNDACQWFIDRADIIFLVYDPSKLDVGPETEAILDQLKGREMQTKIILNKADQVRPEELMRVQGTLIWNISPLMSSTEPPVMYSTSLWSLPYEVGAPTRLLQAQESAFLKDLRDAIDKRVENKIASARRFAVRVRNHAKMVDCYLTTYYNHKTFFGNKKKVSDDIIEHPQNYHIYEGLSTLTNISRYDLPDPDVYKDFFRLNPVYEFQQLSATCTYFRGCPINRLDVAIAYDLPELIGKYKQSVDEVLHKDANTKK